MSLNRKLPTSTKNTQRKYHLLASEFYLTFNQSILDPGLTDNVSLLNTAPWTLPTPTVHIDLALFKKDTTDPETSEQFYLKLVSEYPTFHKIFTDGSKSEDGVAAAALCSLNSKKPYTRRLPNDSSYIQYCRTPCHLSSS